MRIYADNAATTRLFPTALEAMMPYLTEQYGNPSSLHSEGQAAAEAMEKARVAMASMLNCSPREIYFTGGGSEADNQAILSAAYIGARKGKKHIISSAFEHHAVLHTLKKLEREGFEIQLLSPGTSGNISPEDVAAAIREDSALVTLMYANNEIGSVLPIREIGKLCREKKVLFHSDAVQAVGHIPIDVKADNLDLLSLSAHKFHGPKGVGALYARNGILLTNVIEGGAQERGKRGGTENVAGIVGMAAAFEESLQNREEKNLRIRQVRDRLIEGLSRIPYSVLNGDPLCRLEGNVHFCFEGIEGESMLLLLDDRGIAASSGSACTSGSLDPSHVLLALGRPHEIAHGSLRLSLSEENTPEEADYIIRSVTEIVEQLRNMSPLWRDKLEGTRPFILER